MARRRNKEHQGLPARWRWKDGAYRYLVPKGQEDQWDGKTEFRLGGTLSEAYITYAGRIARTDGAIQTIAQLLDRYLLDEVPNKAERTQKEDHKNIRKLREWIGHHPVAEFKPKHAYELRNHIKQQATRGTGEKYANRLMALLKVAFTTAIEWGVIEDHPMTDGKFKMFPESRSKLRVPEINEIREAAKDAHPTLQCYIDFKLATGLRITDILGIKFSDISDDFMRVPIGKTAKTVGRIQEYEMTPELKAIVRRCRSIPPLSQYLFHTKFGKSYLKHDRTYEGFSSMWTRWQRKLPKELKFAERTIRNRVGYQDDLETASNRMGHTTTAPTQKYYRSPIHRVTPLSSN